MPRYSIETPTLVRPSLVKACQSIDSQTDDSWEHIVMVDLPELTATQQKTLRQIRSDSRRKIASCGVGHRDYGNSCRRSAIAQAKGEYVLFIDDDDHYADARVLETLRCVTHSWALFPIKRCGQAYFGPAYSNGMVIFKREGAPTYSIANGYGSEVTFIDTLARGARPQMLTGCRPLLVYDKPSFGDGTETVNKKDLAEDARLLREVDAMSADEYKRKMQGDRAFRAQVEAAFARKWLSNRREHVQR